MVLESSKLEHINQAMLSSKIYTGNHLKQMGLFLYGNSNSALAEICRVLLNYTNNEKLELNEEDLKESYYYYTSKSRSQALENNLSGKVHSVDAIPYKVEFRTPNTEALSTLKDVDIITQSQYIVVVNPTSVGAVITHLKDHGVNTQQFKKYMKENGITDRFFRLAETSSSSEGYIPNKIVLNRIQGKNDVEIICDPIFTTCIREIRGFRINPETKLYNLGKSHLYTLYSKVRNLAIESNIDVDLDDFDKFINVNVGVDKLTIKAFSLGNNVVMNMPMHPLINSALVRVDTLVFDGDTSRYIFNKRYLNEVIEKIKSTHLGVDVQPLLDLNQQMLQEYTKNTCTFLDLSKFPDIRKPWKHQIASAQVMLQKRKHLLCDEMGAGKTLTSILAALSVGFTLGGPLVVVCPNSVKYNWEDEIREIDTRSSIFIVEGKSTNIRPANWIIINYDILSSHLVELISLKPKVAIFDEAHRLKGITNQGVPATDRAKSSMQLSAVVPYVYPLTGTPTPTGPINLFNLLKMIDDPLSDKFEEFGLRYCDGKPSKQGYDFSGASNEVELNEKVSHCMTRNLKEDCLDLPPKRRTFMRLENLDLKEYRRCVDEYMSQRDLHPAVVNLVLVNQMKKFLAYAKIPETIALANKLIAKGDCCVIFTDFTEVINQVSAGIKGRVATITGKDKAFAKLEKCKQLNAGDLDALVCNTKAGGEGLNMTRANKMIINDLTWVPTALFQAEDRIHRGGQLRKTEIVYLIADEAEIDDKLSNIIEKRAKSSSLIVDGRVTKDKDIHVMKSVLKYLEEVRSNKRSAGDFVVDSDTYNVTYSAIMYDDSVITGTAIFYEPIERVINIKANRVPKLEDTSLEMLKTVENPDSITIELPLLVYSVGENNVPSEKGQYILNFNTHTFNQDEELPVLQNNDFVVLPHGESIWCTSLNTPETINLLEEYRNYLVYTRCMKSSQIPVVLSQSPTSKLSLNLLNLNLIGEVTSNDTQIVLPDRTTIGIVIDNNKYLITDTSQARKTLTNLLKGLLQNNVKTIQSQVVKRASVTFPDGREFEIQATEDPRMFKVPDLDIATLSHSNTDKDAFDDLSLDLDDYAEESSSEQLQLSDAKDTTSLSELDTLELDDTDAKPTYPLYTEGEYQNPPYELKILSKERGIYEYSKEQTSTTLHLQILFEDTSQGKGESYTLKFKMTEQNNATQSIELMRFVKISQIAGKFGKLDEVGDNLLRNLRRIETMKNNSNFTGMRSHIKYLKSDLDKTLKLGD